MDNLPVNIDTLTAEILIYKDNAGRCVLEIGRRLKQVKETLPHGAWLTYLKDRVDFSERTARRFIKCFVEFGNRTLTSDLGDHSLNTPLAEYLPTGHMFELLTLPADQREEFIAENHPEDMTQKQLREAIKARKAAEERAALAERDKTAKQAYIETLNQKVNHLMMEHARNGNLKNKIEILEGKLKAASDPIVVEQPVQVFPPDYERIKRENAELKAHKQGMTLQQLSQVDKTCQQYARTAAEEEKLAKAVIKVVDVINSLPSNQEIEDLARCYLKFSPADTTDEITVTCNEIENGIAKLSQLKAALRETIKLKVVK